MHTPICRFLMVSSLMLAPGAAFAQNGHTTPLPKHFPLGTEACFGRTYDSNHLAHHPKQQVTSFHIFRDFSPDPNLEVPPTSREELVKNDGDNGTVGITAFVRFRNRNGIFSNSLDCRRDNGNSVRCSIECDGGSFKLNPAGVLLIAENNGFVVIGGCGASDEEAEANPVFVTPGVDDKIFRLNPLPVQQCLALRDAQKPAWAKRGSPIRTRFDRDSAVCFSHRYSDTHLARHPSQSVRHLAVLKQPGARPEEPGWPVFKLVFRAELKDGRTLEKEASCSPENYAYTCSVDTGGDVHNFYLARAGEHDIMLRDRRGILGDLFGAKPGRDDRFFKLHASAAEDCEF